MKTKKNWGGQSQGACSSSCWNTSWVHVMGVVPRICVLGRASNLTRNAARCVMTRHDNPVYLGSLCHDSLSITRCNKTRMAVSSTLRVKGLVVPDRRLSRWYYHSDVFQLLGPFVWWGWPPVVLRPNDIQSYHPTMSIVQDTASIPHLRRCIMAVVIGQVHFAKAPLSQQLVCDAQVFRWNLHLGEFALPPDATSLRHGLGCTLREGELPKRRPRGRTTWKQSKVIRYAQLFNILGFTLPIECDWITRLIRFRSRPRSSMCRDCFSQTANSPGRGPSPP